MDWSISRMKRKARFQLSSNGFNLVVIYVMIVALYVGLFFLLRRFSIEALLIINGPIMMGLVIYFLAMARLEKEPKTRAEKDAKNGKFTFLGIEASFAKGVKINLDNAQHPYRISLKYLFYGFKYFLNAAALYIWTTFLILAWSVLLIVPGIIKMIELSMCFFILADKPTMDIRKVVKLSTKMMQGHKKEFLMLNLSFIVWILFSIASLSLGFIITIPYMLTTYGIFYDELKKESIKNGVIAEDEIETKRLWEH